MRNDRHAYSCAHDYTGSTSVQQTGEDGYLSRKMQPTELDPIQVETDKRFAHSPILVQVIPLRRYRNSRTPPGRSNTAGTPDTKHIGRLRSPAVTGIDFPGALLFSTQSTIRREMLLPVNRLPNKRDVAVNSRSESICS